MNQNEFVQNGKNIVKPYDKNEKLKDIIKSKYIICPKCGENCRIKIENYKIKLFDCKNGHSINNILLDDYEDIMNVDLSKIICDKCKVINKSNINNNEFYKCITCKKNLCPKCKLEHEQNHNIINYEQQNYICEKDNEIYTKYCNTCKKNICLSCADEHQSHNTIYYDNI